MNEHATGIFATTNNRGINAASRLPRSNEVFRGRALIDRFERQTRENETARTPNNSNADGKHASIRIRFGSVVRAAIAATLVMAALATPVKTHAGAWDDLNSGVPQQQSDDSGSGAGLVMGAVVIFGVLGGIALFGTERPRRGQRR